MSLSRDELDDMRGKNYRMPYAYPTETRMTALLDEVDRLRRGIRGGLNESRDMQSEVRSSVTLAYLQSVLDELLDPTEGETDADA